MAKYKKKFYIFYISFLLSSCALAKAVYLGPEDFSQTVALQYANESYNAENINGVFPDAVYIKTRTQTFNLYHYYIISGGRIWYKSIDVAKEPVSWTLFDETGLPHNSRKQGFTKAETIAEISADADELVALSEEGNFYRYCFDKIIAHKSGVWLDRQGWPKQEQLYLDARTAKNRAWAIGKRNIQVLYYEDTFGNQHHNGTQEIVTTYMLLEDGQEVTYADTGLPGDFSRNYSGPERGAFKAVSLSASSWYVAQNDVLAVASIVDNLKLMAYDYYGGWSATTGHLANLRNNPADPEWGGWSTEQAVDVYLNAGVSPEKMVLGLSFYGRAWSGVEDGGTNGLFQPYTAAVPDAFSWPQIKELTKEGSAYTRYWDDAAQAPYLYNGDVFITYTDAEAIALIAAYAKEKGLGGVMVWEYAHDIEGDLFNVLNKNFQK